MGAEAPLIVWSEAPNDLPPPAGRRSGGSHMVAGGARRLETPRALPSRFSGGVGTSLCSCGWAHRFARAAGHIALLVRLGTSLCSCGWAHRFARAAGHIALLVRLGTSLCLCGWSHRFACAAGHIALLVRLGTSLCLCGWAHRFACAAGHIALLVRLGTSLCLCSGLGPYRHSTPAAC